MSQSEFDKLLFHFLWRVSQVMELVRPLFQPCRKCTLQVMPWTYKCDGRGKTWGDGQVRLLARQSEKRQGRKTVRLAELSTAAGVAVHTVAGLRWPCRVALLQLRKHKPPSASHHGITSMGVYWTFFNWTLMKFWQKQFPEHRTKCNRVHCWLLTLNPNPNPALIIELTVLWPCEHVWHTSQNLAAVKLLVCLSMLTGMKAGADPS